MPNSGLLNKWTEHRKDLKKKTTTHHWNDVQQRIEMSRKNQEKYLKGFNHKLKRRLLQGLFSLISTLPLKVPIEMTRNFREQKK